MTKMNLEDALRKLIEHAHLYPVDAIDNESAMYDTNLQEACRTATEWIITTETQPAGEWVPVPDDVVVECACGRDYCQNTVCVYGEDLALYESDNNSEAHIDLPDDIRLCRRIAEPTDEAKTLEQANEYIAILEREIMDMKAQREHYEALMAPKQPSRRPEANSE